jgi:hypothetical protein
MSELDVHKIICPITERQLVRARELCGQAELIILSLRRKLIELDPGLPDAYDGTAWARIEQIEAPSGTSGSSEGD